jgi:hypothetical protein
MAGLGADIGHASGSATDAQVDAPPRTIDTDRLWDVLPPLATYADAERRRSLRRAGELLADWTIHLAGVPVDGMLLTRIAERAPNEPIVRVVREALRRPVDFDDLLFFLDDVLREGAAGRRGEVVWVTPGRARKAGILLHPDDVFRADAPRVYGTRGPLSIDIPRPQVDLPLARDGEALGPNWTMRFPNPASEAERLRMLESARPGATFAARIRALIEQLRRQGADVFVNSTVRSRERGYLMWGAFLLSRSSDERELRSVLGRLEEANREWQLDVPIGWAHPAGWRATKNAAREMADTYEVVYATEQGARASNHYGGEAVDFVAVGLPRRLTLTGVDGVQRSFDLSSAGQPRDLSLTPGVIDWIEQHFSLSKLRSDYPHWDDVKEPNG